MSHDLSPIPASETQLGQFVSYLALANLAHSTIKCYLAAVRHLHIAEGVPDPQISKMARLEQILRGIKLSQAKSGKRGKERLPISIDILATLKAAWESTATEDATMLWAAASLCFFGFFRAGELMLATEAGYDEGAHLSFQDISVDSLTNPQHLQVRLKSSKTDPFRTGVDVFVGRTNSSLCPVAAVLAYLARRGPRPGPLFFFANGKPLTRPRFVTEVKQALAQAGVDSSGYSGHSFRSGAATTAAQRGIGDATIKMLGRWKSNAYQLYVKTPRQQLAQVSKLLAGKEGKHTQQGKTEVIGP